MKSVLTFLIRQEMAHELANGVIADGGEGDGLQTQTAGPDRDIDRAAADAGLEGGDIVELSADIAGEEIQRDAPNRDQINDSCGIMP